MENVCSDGLEESCRIHLITTDGIDHSKLMTKSDSSTAESNLSDPEIVDKSGKLEEKHEEHIEKKDNSAKNITEGYETTNPVETNISDANPPNENYGKGQTVSSDHQITRFKSHQASANDSFCNSKTIDAEWNNESSSESDNSQADNAGTDAVDKDTSFTEKGDNDMVSLPWKVVELDVHTTEVAEKEGTRLAYKVTKTVFLVLVWVSLGLCGEVTGPTLLDLILRTKSNFDSVSFGLSGRGAGFFIGSVLGGVVVDKLGLYCDIILAIAIDGNAATTFAIPWMPNTDLLFVMTMLQGTMEGVMNISGQKLILEMWEEKATGPLHLLHGGYGVGSFIIPLIANPFLAITKQLSESTVVGGNVTALHGVTMTTRIPTTTEVVVKESEIEYAYLIAAAISLLVSLVFYGYQLAGRRGRRKQNVEEGGSREKEKVLTFKQMINPATCAGGRLYYGIQIFLFVFLYFIQAEGGETAAGKFVRAYAVKHLDFSEDNGSYINTVFWVAFAVGRVLGLLTARFIPIRILVMLESGACLLSSILLVVFGEKSTAFWILVPAIGFSIAPLFPSGIGWANYHIEMTGVAITFFMLGGAIGNMVYIRLTGYLFDHYGYRTFLYVLLGFSIASFVICSLMSIIGAQHGSRFDHQKEQEDVEVYQNDGKGDSSFNNEAYIHE